MLTRLVVLTSDDNEQLKAAVAARESGLFIGRRGNEVILVRLVDGEIAWCQDLMPREAHAVAKALRGAADRPI